ncbi:CUB and sushi domain-containing protein 1-like [Patiria miniata]|uniref:CUB domain-containing protein n=1 Tax=Patiria miniata TaxID=46514 RepID=A0A913ZR32_PATMI|nr:CUB and sushi domain-containing protein 1-like [Patiria miniata]
MACTYVIQAARDQRVMVTFMTFDTEQGYDKLWIGNGLTPMEDVILQLSGTNFPARVASMEHSMYLMFSSDNKYKYQGFSLRVEHVTPDQVSCEAGETLCDYKDFICVSENSEGVCPDLECDSNAVTFLDDAVIVKSPDYPQPYPAGLYCRWDVPSRGLAPATLIRVLDFSTEAGEDVAQVSGLTFPGGEPADYTLTGTTTKIVAVVFNASMGLTVRFRTDSNLQFTGFHFHVTNVNLTAGETDWCMTDGESGFLCEEGACLVSSAKCDGFLDCLNGEDENDCGKP